MRAAFDLMFHPRSSEDGEELWHVPLAHICMQALAERFASQWPEEAAGEPCPAAEDVAVWARNFAASSFNDPLFGGCIALFLRDDVPADIQVVLRPSEV